jgi:hypothetical protein
MRPQPGYLTPVRAPVIFQPGKPVAQPVDKATGRLYKPDYRDRRYMLTGARLTSLRKTLAKAGEVARRTAPVIKPRVRPWNYPRPLRSQGYTSRCVVFAGFHVKQAAPIVQRLDWADSYLTRIYDLARARDGFPMPHEGTTARAVCDVMISEGHFKEYLHLDSSEAVQETLATVSPLMHGSIWLPGMYDIDAKGYVQPTGEWDGSGHETTCLWYFPKPKTKNTRAKWGNSYLHLNSWNEEPEYPWGMQDVYEGAFLIDGDDWDWLTWSNDGDVVLPTDVRVVKAA